MWQMWLDLDPESKKKISKNAILIGSILMLVGLAGVFFPGVMSLAVVVFIAWLMVFGGALTGYFTARSDASDWVGWLKSFVLIVVGLFMVFKPFPGIAAIGLLLAIYFLLDFFGNTVLAITMRPAKGWWLWLLNGLLSLLLAIIFLVGWPFNSLLLVGLFVGISLFFDGLVLFILGFSLKKES